MTNSLVNLVGAELRTTRSRSVLETDIILLVRTRPSRRQSHNQGLVMADADAASGADTRACGASVFGQPRRALWTPLIGGHSHNEAPPSPPATRRGYSVQTRINIFKIKITTVFCFRWSTKINSRRGAAGRAGAWLERAAGAAGRQQRARVGKASGQRLLGAWVLARLTDSEPASDGRS